MDYFEDPHLCLICFGYHPLKYCKYFKTFTVLQRIYLVRVHRYCPQCFSKSHLLDECTLIHTCDRCPGPHHTMLHREDHPSEYAIRTDHYQQNPFHRFRSGEIPEEESLTSRSRMPRSSESVPSYRHGSLQRGLSREEHHDSGSSPSVRPTRQPWSEVYNLQPPLSSINTPRHSEEQQPTSTSRDPFYSQGFRSEAFQEPLSSFKSGRNTATTMFDYDNLNESYRPTNAPNWLDDRGTYDPTPIDHFYGCNNFNCPHLSCRTRSSRLRRSDRRYREHRRHKPATRTRSQMPTNRQFFDQGLDAFSMPSTAPASWATGRSSTELGSSSLNFSVRRSREPSSESERSSLSREEPVRPSTFSKGKRERFRASSVKDDKEIFREFPMTKDHLSSAIIQTDESHQEHQEPPSREEHMSTDFLSSWKAAHSIKQSTSEHCFETGMELPLSEPTTTENPEPLEELPDTKPFRLLRKPSKDDLSKLHLRLSLAETGPKIQAQPLTPLRNERKSDSDASTSLQLRLPDSTQLSSPSELSTPQLTSGRQPLSHREHLPEIQSALQQLLHHFNGPKEFWHTPANRRRQQLMRQELSQIKSLLKQLLTEVNRSQPRCFRTKCSCPEQANLKTWLHQLLPPLRHCRVLASSRQLTSTIDDLINHLRDYQRKSTESASTSEESYGFQNYLEQLQNLRKSCKLSVRGHRVEILQQRLKLQVILRQLLKDALDQLAKILIILPK